MNKLLDVERDHMLDLARNMLTKAYAPYSHFSVGACIKTRKGNYYQGCNIENVSYSLVQCAEACAIANMVSQGEQEIEAAVIISSSSLKCAPCGACRQRLREFCQEDLWVYMFDCHGQYTVKLLSELLPDSFGPEHMELSL